MFGGATHAKTKKHLSRLKQTLRNVKRAKSQFSVKKRLSAKKKYNKIGMSVKKSIPDTSLTDIVAKYGKHVPIFVPSILNCDYVEKSYISGRTNGVLNALKSDTFKKRVFMVSSHASLTKYIHISPKNTVLFQTGDLCSVTYGKGDKAIFMMFNSKDKFKAFDIFFGAYGITGPYGKNENTILESIYSSLNMYLPYEFCPNKMLSYTYKEKVDFVDNFGIFENKLDKDIYDTNIYNNPINTLYDSEGYEVYVDYLFNREGGVQSSTIIDLINTTYKDSINIIIFSSCSIIYSYEEPKNYSIVSTLMRRPGFYSLDPIKQNTMEHMMFLTQRGDITSKVAKKQKKYLHHSEIPSEFEITLYDKLNRCKFKIYNIETLWWIRNNLNILNYNIEIKLFNYVKGNDANNANNANNASVTSSNFENMNNIDNANYKNWDVRKKILVDTVVMPLAEYINKSFFDSSKEMLLDYYSMYDYIINLYKNNNNSYNL